MEKNTILKFRRHRCIQNYTETDCYDTFDFWIPKEAVESAEQPKKTHIVKTHDLKKYGLKGNGGKHMKLNRLYKMAQKKYAKLKEKILPGPQRKILNNGRPIEFLL
jgi:hypothetical protein